MSFQSLAVLSSINFVDAISYMAVAPSLIFYVQSVGGTKEQYGLIMSAFSLASFAGKPVYGIWVDRSGNKFRMPYIASFILAILGGLFYFFASTIGSSSTAVALALILTGRVMGGLGAGNAALGYAYLAITIPFDQQTKTNSLLSMSRILGMALGPVVNLLLAKVDMTISLFGSSLHLTPLNMVGLLLAILNSLALTAFLIFLQEPETKEKPSVPNAAASGGGNKQGRRMSVEEKRSVWKAVSCIEILLPILIILIINSSFQLIETALAPAAADGLGWGTVETSGVLGASSVVIFIIMLSILILSKYLSDTMLVAIGAILWAVGGTGIYVGWTRDAPVWHYVVPVMVSVAGFPFIAPSNRSNFSKSVACKPELEGMQGSMQAVLSMAASVAGFVTPGFVAAYVIRTPDQVDASNDNRELTPMALYTPILSSLILVGLYFMWRKQQAEEAKAAQEEDEEAATPTEQTSLLRRGSAGGRASIVSIEDTFSKQTEVQRRCSTEMMGFPGFDTHDEKVRRSSMLADWKALQDLDLSDVEDEDN